MAPPGDVGGTRRPRRPRAAHAGMGRRSVVSCTTLPGHGPARGDGPTENGDSDEGERLPGAREDGPPRRLIGEPSGQPAMSAQWPARPGRGR